MPDSQSNSQSEATREGVERGRRNLVLLIPAAIAASIAATLGAAAWRFLSPPTSGAQGEGAGWTTLAPLGELKGEEPLMRQVALERTSGWMRVREERVVYVLPRENNRVVSAVCPHEGCEVVWRAAERDFFCPCHDSRFAADGARLSGPAHRSLAEIPARIENGLLQIQYPTGALTDDEQQNRSVRG
ncbi:MAG TPA: Rieske 2Fe-2S domain-containing protein [Pyrinomonadaceae bacterium]|jgi:Rieske Fe-S protein